MKKMIIIGLLIATTLGAPGGKGPGQKAPPKPPNFEEWKEKNNEVFLDPKEEAAAKEEYNKHEAQVEKNNQDYFMGMSNFMEEMEPWDDEPLEQFEAEKTGTFVERTWEGRGLGLILTPEHEMINTPEEIDFHEALVSKYDRDGFPDTWDSRAKGN